MRVRITTLISWPPGKRGMRGLLGEQNAQRKARFLFKQWFSVAGWTVKRCLGAFLIVTIIGDH